MYGETGLLIVVLLIGIAVWIYILAGYGLFFSFIKSGEIVFVEEGKSFYRLIPNIPGYGVKDNKIAPLGEGVKQPKSFLEFFGLDFILLGKFISMIFHGIKLFQKNEIETEKEKGGTIEETNFGIISHRSQIISSLRHKNPYPVILRNMELSGQLKIDIYFDVIFEAVDPVFAVFILSGKWLSLATNAFSGIVSDILKQIELRRPSSAKIIATTDPSDNDDSNRYFEEINKETKFNDETLKKIVLF